MKQNIIEAPMPVDRLATPDEILAAVLPFPDPIEQGDADVLCEIASDIGDYMGIAPSEFETLLMKELNLAEDALPN